MSSTKVGSQSPSSQSRRKDPEHIESGVSHDTRRDTRASEPFVEWLQCPSWPAYEVSNEGQVRRLAPSGSNRSKPGRFMSQWPDADGYFRVSLWNGKRGISVLVHQLVAEAFVGPRPDDMTVNHMDGDKTNNHATNVEYLSRGDNVRHGFDNGAYDGLRGEGNRSAKLTEQQVGQIKSLLDTHNNCELARRFGVSDVSIRKIRIGKTWAHVA